MLSCKLKRRAGACVNCCACGWFRIAEFASAKLTWYSFAALNLLPECAQKPNDVLILICVLASLRRKFCTKVELRTAFLRAAMVQSGFMLHVERCSST